MSIKASSTVFLPQVMNKNSLLALTRLGSIKYIFEFSPILPYSSSHVEVD